MPQLVRTLVLIAALVGGGIATATPAQAHRSGCHRWHTCQSDTGSYVCGDLGYACNGADSAGELVRVASRTTTTTRTQPTQRTGQTTLPNTGSTGPETPAAGLFALLAGAAFVVLSRKAERRAAPRFYLGSYVGPRG